jgi:hypothetical protein
VLWSKLKSSVLRRGTTFLLKQPGRGYRFAQRIVFAGLHRLYVWFLVVPHLRNQEGLSENFSVKPAFNAVVIFDLKALHKVALRKTSTIGLEYGNYGHVRSQYPALSKILPDYRIGKSAFLYYLSMTRYKPVSLETSLIHAVSVYELMRVCGSRERQLRISNSGTLQAGLKVVQDVYGDSTGRCIYQIVDSFLAGGQYHVGFTHGDFHSRNILADINDDPKLIDLDCVRFHGIQELDALSFALEMEWSKSGRPWYETIAGYFRENVPDQTKAVLNGFGVEYSHGLGVTYLVDRIGQETMNYGFKYTRVLLDAAIKEVLASPHELMQKKIASTPEYNAG